MFHAKACLDSQEFQELIYIFDDTNSEKHLISHKKKTFVFQWYFYTFKISHISGGTAIPDKFVLFFIELLNLRVLAFVLFTKRRSQYMIHTGNTNLHENSKMNSKQSNAGKSNEFKY